MAKKAFRAIANGLADAIAFSQGEKVRGRTHKVGPVTSKRSPGRGELPVPRRSRRDSNTMANAPSGALMAMARQLVKVQEKARELGIFVGDRELLVCPKCGLMEDVLADGRLVTCHEVGTTDTGLRFAAHPRTEDRFVCPECGTVLRPQWL